MNTSFDKLPDINFAEKDTALIEQEVISYFEGEIGKKLYDGDPKRLLLLAIIKYLALQRSLIDFSGKQNLLRYASEGYLQNLAALIGPEILPPSAAITTLKFTLSTTLQSSTIIKKGTRTTPGYGVYFATTEDVEIPAGELSVTAHAECTQTGVIGNGFYPGQVNRLSDTFPFNFSVENITLTQGGADREDIEAFRERVRLAPESYSSAGPYGAYIFWAKTASQLIMDVSVTSPNPGEVEIVPLLKNGEIPTQSLLDDVFAECSDDRRRPLTDKVIVRAPEVAMYKLDFTYYISRRDSAVGLSIQKKVADAVEDFILWQKSTLGNDINPSKLTEMIMKAGAKRVAIAEPVFTVLKYFQVAVADMANIKITYGGLEDD